MSHLEVRVNIRLVIKVVKSDINGLMELFKLTRKLSCYVVGWLQEEVVMMKFGGLIKCS